MQVEAGQVAAEAVFEAVVDDRFLVLPQDDFFQLAVDRWERMSERLNPESREHVPGLPSRTSMIDELLASMASAADDEPTGG